MRHVRYFRVKEMKETSLLLLLLLLLLSGKIIYNIIHVCVDLIYYLCPCIYIHICIYIYICAKAQLMLYIYPVDPNLFDKRRQIRF